MNKPLKVLTIIGSPQGKRSNTLAFSNAFLDDVEAAGLILERSEIVLSHDEVMPCKGCWNCTIEKPCPLRHDGLEDIKKAMVECDMLILGSPVYTNQVTAQMKALFDRLFTWCHIFPLLGKYGLSVTTTGNDGQDEVGEFLEKMLATYGIHSFGTVVGTGAYTPGFFPRRESEVQKYRKLAKTIAETVLAGKTPKQSVWLRKMFKVMKRKMTGIQTVRFIAHGATEGVPDPPAAMVKLVRSIMKRRNAKPDQTERLSRLMSFEFRWWVDRNWLVARSFPELERIPVPEDFALQDRLLG